MKIYIVLDNNEGNYEIRLVTCDQAKAQAEYEYLFTSGTPCEFDVGVVPDEDLYICVDGKWYERQDRYGDVWGKLIEYDLDANINEPGAREERDGVTVVQMAKRSEQLEGTAEYIEHQLKKGLREDTQESVIDPYEVKRLMGYCEHLRIIADELKGAGK